MYFYVSGTFPNSNWPGIFRALIFYHENHLEKNKSTRWAPEAKQAHVAWARVRSRHPCPFGPRSSMLSIFVSWRSAWPKNAYIKTPPPLGDRDRGGKETWNTETEAVPANIGGGNAAGVALDASPPSPTSTPSSPLWRGSSPPLDYGFVAVACSISLLCFNV
jgi:hypothetical protein